MFCRSFLACQSNDRYALLSDCKCGSTDVCQKDKYCLTTNECVDSVEHEFVADYTGITCDSPCEGKLITTAITCEVKGKDLTVHEAACGTKPETMEQPCNADVTCVWEDKYADCTVTCGGGKQAYTPVCKAGTEEVNASHCKEEAPTKSEKDCAQNVCVDAAWVDSYGACDVTCGGGKQAYIPKCQEGEIEVDEAKCTEAAPTKAPKDCAAAPCGQWTEDTYGPCTVTCNGGTQAYQPECQVDGKAADASNCVSPAPTKESRPCNTNACANEGVQDSTATLTVILAMVLLCLLF